MAEHALPFWIDAARTAKAEQANLLGAVRSMIAARNALKDVIGRDYCNDPGLELLLVLFEAHATATPVSIATAASRTGVPRAVAVRWLSAFAREDLATETDGTVALTAQGWHRMTTAVRAVVAGQVAFHRPRTD